MGQRESDVFGGVVAEQESSHCYSLSSVLPDKQTAEMCLRNAALERKLGEIDRGAPSTPESTPTSGANGIISKLRQAQKTPSEMLRIERSVQAQFNTEVAVAEKEAYAGTNGLPFVAARHIGNAQPAESEELAKPATAETVNADEIRISDDEEDIEN
jgi:pre-mRNA-splicing factor SYF1